MKSISNKHQSGSVHVIVISILVVIILGLVGYLFWTNVIARNDSKNEKDSAATATKLSTASTTDSSAKPSSTNNDGYLVLEDWKIKFKLPKNIGEVRYYKEPNVMFNEDSADKSVYGFTTKRNEERGERCSKATATDSDVVYLATLIRYKNKINWGPASPPQSVNNNQPIEGWHYYVAESQGDCSTNASKDDVSTINQDWEGIQQLLLSATAL